MRSIARGMEGRRVHRGGMPRSLRAFPAPREPPSTAVQHFTFALTDLTGTRRFGFTPSLLMKLSAFSKCYAKYTFISGLLKNCLALKRGEGISKPMMLDFLGEGKALPLRSCSHRGFFITKRQLDARIFAVYVSISLECVRMWKTLSTGRKRKTWFSP